MEGQADCHVQPSHTEWWSSAAQSSCRIFKRSSCSVMRVKLRLHSRGGTGHGIISYFNTSMLAESFILPVNVPHISLMRGCQTTVCPRRGRSHDVLNSRPLTPRRLRRTFLRGQVKYIKAERTNLGHLTPELNLNLPLTQGRQPSGWWYA